MTGDQYILAVRGALDGDAARLLLAELRTLLGAGHGRILVDAAGLGPVVAEGVAALMVGVSDLPAGATVELVRLNDQAGLEFQLAGWPVSERGVVLAGLPDV